jgi:acetyl-CoA carboxylase biotin carboxylase subunit
MFRSVLVANRGEIAVRIIRACKDLGVRTVAVFSDADREALHVRLADSAYHLGESPARRSYLAIDRVVAAAREAGADAVHPGYGLLSENADFAAAVRDAGLAFIGPSAAAIAMMGDKVAARAAARDCGIPVLAGSPIAAAATAQAEAAAIGFPLVVKAAFGGGGRGMRIVRDAAALADALADASREAQSSFGRGEVFLERYLERPRHVEVQVLGDAHGHIVHLQDRDCSVQRRHQKLVEEAPAPTLPQALREGMQQAAVRLAARVGYAGAGTVEFLVDARREGFHFLEMNTRLQVEHGVSELVTGVDIVEQQLRIAAGERLEVRQEDVHPHGHAIQARIAAEEPALGFRPEAGRIAALTLPSGPWLRTDFGVEAGDEVPPFYDSMIGKVLAWGATRDAARTRLARALGELRIEGIRTNTAYLARVVAAPAFADIAHDIQWIEREWLPALADAAASTAPATAGAPAAVPFRRRVLRTPQGIVEVETFVAQPAARVRVAPAADARRAAIAESAAASGTRPAAPIDGTIVRILVAAGESVEAGAALAVLEAMKMELPILAGRAGRIAAVHVAAGATVKAGTLLFSFAD